MELNRYKSYDYNCQLNSLPILKVCLNDQITKLAYDYLGTIPKIYSINTFLSKTILMNLECKKELNIAKKDRFSLKLVPNQIPKSLIKTINPL